MTLPTWGSTMSPWWKRDGVMTLSYLNKIPYEYLGKSMSHITCYFTWCFVPTLKLLSFFLSLTRLHLSLDKNWYGNSSSFENGIARFSPIRYGEELTDDDASKEILENMESFEESKPLTNEAPKTINVGTKEELWNLKIKTNLDATQRARMIDLLK